MRKNDEQKINKLKKEKVKKEKTKKIPKNKKTEKSGRIPEIHGFRQRERPVGELLAFRGEYK